MNVSLANRSIPTPNLGPVMPYVTLLAGMISLVVGTSFAKSLFPLVGAEGASAVRVGLAAIVLVCVFRPWKMKLTRAEALGVVAYGLAMGLLNLTFYVSLKTIPLGIALAIEFAGPLGLALLSSRRLVHFAWVGLAVAGLLMLLPIWGGMAALDAVGVGFAAAAGLCWAAYIVLGKRLTHLHPGRTVSLGMVVAALVILPFGVASAGPALLSPPVLMIGLVVALLSSALPYLFEMIAMRAIPKQTFGVLLSVEPAIGAMAGLILLGEQLASIQWIAVAAIVAASVGAVTINGKEKPVPVPA